MEQNQSTHPPHPTHHAHHTAPNHHTTMGHDCCLFTFLASPPVLLLLVACALPSLLWAATYFLPLLLMKVLGPQDLKKKYNATWALVTGR